MPCFQAIKSWDHTGLFLTSFTTAASPAENPSAAIQGFPWILLLSCSSVVAFVSR
jgi:hypothetical protein